jgi:hypothetical protein
MSVTVTLLLLSAFIFLTEACAEAPVIFAF